MRAYLVLILFAMLAACSTPVVKEPVPVIPSLPEEPIAEPEIEKNPYTQHFVARDLHGIELQGAVGEPKIYQGRLEMDDYQRMLSDGYEMVGYASFESGVVPHSYALAQASRVNAAAVIVYTRPLVELASAVRSRQTQQQSERKSVMIGNEKAYSHFASYWARLMPQALGVHVMQRRDGDAEPGLIVLAVVTGSPAATAGVAIGDRLLTLGGETLSSGQVLQAASQRYAGQEVELVFQRAQAQQRVRVTPVSNG